LGLTGDLFLAALGCGWVLAFVRHPIFGLLTYVAVYYLSPTSRWWGAGLPDIRWSLLTALVTLVAVLVRPRKTQVSIPLFKHRAMRGLVVFLVWVIVQTGWALDPVSHWELLILTFKYVLLVGLIYQCIETEAHLRMFLSAHVLGCIYLGWLVYTTYTGGRFESFGSADINEANAGALQIVTGALVAGSLFMSGNYAERIALFCGMPLIVNALIATISRSGFLELGCGGLMYNLFAPKTIRLRVRILSALAVVLFMMLTNPVYWERIGSIEESGEQVEGVDTGGGRLELIQAQLGMFAAYPLGCGHRCTAVLSKQFLDDSLLTGTGEQRARASHNTIMTMMVEHGIPGLMLYLMLLLWLYRSVVSLIRSQRDRSGFLPTLIPAIAGVTAAIIVGDFFVDYLILECRAWLIAVIMVMLNMSAAAAPAQAVTEQSMQGGRPRRVALL
jgi:O-antigen ligase